MMGPKFSQRMVGFETIHASMAVVVAEKTTEVAMTTRMVNLTLEMATVEAIRTAKIEAVIR